MAQAEDQRRSGSVDAGLIESLAAAEDAVTRGLNLFHRIDVLHGFGAGALSGSVTRKDPAVVEARNAVLRTVENLAPLLLGARDAYGHPIDLIDSMADSTDGTNAIGNRGAKLCATLTEFLVGVRTQNARRCVDKLRDLESQIQSVRDDLAPPTESGIAEDEIRTAIKDIRDGVVRLEKRAPEPEVKSTPAPRAKEEAYKSFKWAMTQNPNLDTDDDVYDWLTEHPEFADELPKAATWKRQLRGGREHHNDRKNTPRTGRQGKNIVDQDQL